LTEEIKVGYQTLQVRALVFERTQPLCLVGSPCPELHLRYLNRCRANPAFPGHVIHCGPGLLAGAFIR
jgi:hypothetical protein